MKTKVFFYDVFSQKNRNLIPLTHLGDIPQVISWAPPNMRHKERLKWIFWGNVLVEVLRMSIEGPSNNILRTLWDHLWDIPKLHFFLSKLSAINIKHKGQILHIYALQYTYIHIMDIYIYAYIYICICICMYVCIYIYIYIYIYWYFSFLTCVSPIVPRLSSKFFHFCKNLFG